MQKKVAGLTVVVATLAALAVPASASALWGHHLETLPRDVKLGIAGTIKLETSAGGAECRFPIQARLIADTSKGHANTSFPADGTPDCKGLGSYALCQIRSLKPQAPGWPFANTLVQSRELVYTGREVTVEAGLPEEGILIRSQRISTRPQGTFCPARTMTIAPGAVAALPEGGPDTIANVVLSGTLLTAVRTSDGAPLSGQITVSGTLQVADPAQRDTFSIGNAGG